MHPLDLILSRTTPSELARTCGITKQAVNDWRRRARESERFQIPLRHVPVLVKAYRLSKRAIRPDVF